MYFHAHDMKLPTSKAHSSFTAPHAMQVTLTLTTQLSGAHPEKGSEVIYFPYPAPVPPGVLRTHTEDAREGGGPRGGIPVLDSNSKTTHSKGVLLII